VAHDLPGLRRAQLVYRGAVRVSYAELNCISNFTFLTGASHADELVARAKKLGLSGLAIADTNTFAGIVRGELTIEDVLAWGEACVFVIITKTDHAAALKSAFGAEVFLGLKPVYDGEDEARFAARKALSESLDIPLVAMGHVIMHAGRRRRLADVLSCIREKVKIDQLGRLAQPNAEARLKSGFEMRRLFKAYPEALVNTQLIMERCPFSLDELKYERCLCARSEYFVPRTRQRGEFCGLLRLGDYRGLA